MPIFFPDILQNNNSNYPLTDITEIKGNAYPIGVLSETGSIPANKRKIGEIIYVSSSNQFYGYIGATTGSSDWNNTNNWRTILTNGVSGSFVISGSLTVTGNVSSGPMGVFNSASYQNGVLRLFKDDNISSSSLIINSGSFTGSLLGTASWATNAITASFFSGSISNAINAQSSSYPIALTGSTLYSYGSNIYGSTLYNFGTNDNIHFGNEAGLNIATNNRHTSSIFIGKASGRFSDKNYRTINIGENAGSVTGRYSEYTINIGYDSGVEGGVSSSVIIGNTAGLFASNAHYSVLIGYLAGGQSSFGESIGRNNIVIGTGVTLENTRRDSINIGGIIFGTGSHFITSSTPVSTVANGRIGINVSNPLSNFHVSGTVRFPNLSISNKNTILSYDESTGELYIMPTSSIVSSISNVFPYTGTAGVTGSIIATGAVIGGSISSLTDLSAANIDISSNSKFGTNINSTHRITGSLNISGSTRSTGSTNILGDVNITGSINVFGTGSFKNIVYETIQVINAVSTGSNTFGDTTDDTQRLIGNTIVTGSLQVTGSTNLSGALNVSNGITGSLFGTASWANTASFVISSSFATTSSYSVTSSFATTSSYSVTSSFATSASLAQTASFTISSSFATSASWAPENDPIFTAKSASLATTGSNTFIGTQTVTGSLFTSGSNTLIGNTLLTGSITISGSNPPGSTSASIQIYGDIRQTGYHRLDPVTTNIDQSITASYIYVSGSTNDLYFTQNGAFKNTTRLRWLESNMYTGILFGGNLTSTPGSTTFTVASGSGLIVLMNATTGSDPYPTMQVVNWPTQTLPIINSSSAKISYVGINNLGQVIQQTNAWGSTDINQWDDSIALGTVLHLSGSVSTGVFNSPQISYGYPQKTDDFTRAFGPLKMSGHTLQASGSTISIIKTGGTSYREGANYTANPNHPSTVTENAITTTKIYRYYLSGSTPVINTGVGAAGYTVLDPAQRVNTATGALTGVASNKFSIQRVFWIPNSPTNAFIVYYGNAEYASLLEATNAKDSEPFTEAPNTALNAIFLGWICLAGGTTNLTNAADATIIPAGLFRGVGGVGASGTSIPTTLLSTLTDVQLSTLSNGQPLVYSTAASKWINSNTLTANLTGSVFGTASFATSASWAPNIYNSNGTLTGERTIDQNGNDIIFNASSSYFYVLGQGPSNGVYFESFEGNLFSYQDMSADWMTLYAESGSDWTEAWIRSTRSGSRSGVNMEVKGNNNRTYYRQFADKIELEGNTQIKGLLFISGTTQSGGNGNVLTYNTTTGQIFYTSSTQIGGIAVESDPIFTAISASLATTGSNTFRGNQTITGSINVSGSIVASGSIFVPVVQSIVSSGAGMSIHPYGLGGNTITFNNGNISIASDQDYTIRDRMVISSPSASNLLLSISNTFDRLHLGGTTSAYPAIKRVGSDLSIISGDNSNNTSLLVGLVTGSGFKMDVSGSVRFRNGLTVTGSLFISGTTQNTGINNVLMYDITDGQVYYTASSALITTESDPIFTARSASLATTGSNIFIGNQNVIGFVTASAILVSGSGTQRLQVIGSGSTTTPIFQVIGSQGELFSITDSLSGSLFSVNDISGLPVLEAYSDNTVLMGSYLAPALNTTVLIPSTVVGSNIIYSVPTASYDAVYMDYVIRSGSNGRAGTFTAMYSASAASVYDVSVTPFGDTSGFSFAAIVSGSNFVITGSSATSGWRIKAIIRSI